MKKNLLFVPVVLMSMGLAACQNEDAETSTPTEDVSEENGSDAGSVPSEVRDDEQIPTEGGATDPDYALLEQAKEEYYSGELDAAAGTLSRLLENDLSENPLLRDEAEDLLEEINQEQAENAREENGESSQNSAYAEERQSSLFATEFSEATGTSIQEATDEELEAWLSERETEEAENAALEQVMERENLNNENYFFFADVKEEDWVQVEARESVEQNDVTFSNLIGMYRYNVSTEELQKLDAVTGDYQTIEE